MKLKKKKIVINLNKDNIKSKSIINALEHLEGREYPYHIEEEKIIKDPKLIIKVKNLKKDFKLNNGVVKNVLKGIDMEIFSGENIALLGGNGAGKTTFVEILSGLNKPTSGTIEYLYDFKKSFQENLGIQFQDSSYPNAITVKEVLTFIIDIYGSKLNNDELNALIKIFGIDEYYYNKASKLSGGQQQRLNVLLALIHKPAVIILDELSTGLDISIRTRIKNFIKQYAIENNMTVILISHDMSEVQQLCKKMFFLKDGKILKEDYISNIIRDKSLEEYVEELL